MFAARLSTLSSGSTRGGRTRSAQTDGPGVAVLAQQFRRHQRTVKGVVHAVVAEFVDPARGISPVAAFEGKLCAEQRLRQRFVYLVPNSLTIPSESSSTVHSSIMAAISPARC